MKFFKFVFITLVFVCGFLGYLIWNHFKSPDFGGDFTLTYQAQPWKFSQEPPPLTLLYFGYAKCPDVCPMTLSYAGGAFRQLDEKQLKQTRLVFVSVDQKHDNPQDVADYAKNFFESFIGLSGSQEQIDSAIKLFPASYIVEDKPKSYLGYSISHTDKIFFLNRRGRVVDSLQSPRDSEMIYKKIQENL